MPDYLAAKDWKSVLDMKEHKSIKKTGVSDTLDEYASAKKKDDLGRMVSALEKIIEKAGEVKTAQSKFPKMVSHLAEMAKAAKAEQQKLAPRLGNIANKGEDEDNEDSTLGKSLAKIRQVDVDSAWNFVLVPGKPSSGFVVSKKTLKKSDTEKAFAMKGKRGPFFTGRIYFDASKFVLDLGPEVSPVPGLAKAAKNAASLHAEMNIKVVVRGMGKEIDSDADIEPQEEGGTTGEAPMTPGNHAVAFNTRIDQVEAAIGRFVQSSSVKVEGAGDALQSALGMLRKQITADDRINDFSKRPLFERLDALQQRLADASKPATVSPAAKYPDEAYWAKMAEAVIRLDPGKRIEGAKRLRARLLEVQKQFNEDRALVDPERGQVGATLQRAAELVMQAAAETRELRDTGKTTEDQDFKKRFLAMERRYDQMIKTPGLDPQQVNAVTGAFGILRELYRKGELNTGDERLIKFDRALETMAKRAFALQQESGKQKGQQEMHASLSKSMPFLKKAALPVGLVKDPEAIRGEMATNPALRTLLDKMSAAVKTPGKQAGKEMEAAAREIVKLIEQRNQDAVDNSTPVPPLSASEQLSVDVLKRGQMMQLAADYEGLGAPPWDPGKADIASELQAQLFFLEGSIAQGKPSYQAPNLEGDQGASGSWWIERQEATGTGGMSGKKKYIFKPAETEGSVMAGLEPGAGAPREVLAKRLDEFMAGAGFNVGVCPTTLSSIDSSQLTEVKGSGPMLGSMQQLAETDGPVGAKLADPDFAKTIDKKSYDNVATFDMIFANLDRHAKNVHVKKDPETGQSIMVPIDHGAGLLSPGRLQANAQAMMPGMNVMASKDLPQSHDPLGPEAQEALQRLDPVQMVQEMKRSRDDMARRHPETAGTMPDDAIDAMAARVRFLKAAAGDTPVGDLFKMLGMGAKRIAEVAPNDIPALIKTLKDEVAQYDKAVAQTDEIRGVLDEIGDKTPDNAVVTELQRLGWAWNLTKPELEDWVRTNSKLVGRVLGARIENPELKREIARLLQLALPKDPKAAEKIAGVALDVQYSKLYNIVNADITTGPGTDVKADTLKQEFNTLGGEAELARAAVDFPNDFKDSRTVPTFTKAKSEETFWRKRVTLMRQWDALKRKGGLDELLRLGGSVPREFPIMGAIRTIEELQLSQNARAGAENMDDEDIDERMEEQYPVLKVEVQKLLVQVRHPDTGATHRARNVAAMKAWQEGKKVGAMTLLGRTKAALEKQIADEKVFVKEVDELEAKLLEDLDKADRSVSDQVRPHMNAILKFLDDSRKTTVIGTRDRGKQEFDGRMDNAVKGADSTWSKINAILQKLEQRVPAHAGYPWHGAMTQMITGYRGNLDEFDVGRPSGIGDWVPDAFDSSDALKAALGNADLNSLPPRVKQIAQDWAAWLPDNNGLARGPGLADEIRQLLAQPAI